MKQRIGTYILIMSLFGCGVNSAAQMDYFHKDWEKAKSAAQKSGKPIFIHFTTDWCSWCRRIENDVYKTADGKKALADFVAVSLDCTQRNRSGAALKKAQTYNQLMKKWGGNGYPYLVIVTPEETMLHSWSGYKKLPGFIAELKKSRASMKALSELAALVKKGVPMDLAYYQKAMSVYSAVRRMDKALPAARKVIELDPKNEQGGLIEAALIVLKSAHEKNDEKEAETALSLIRRVDLKNEKGKLEEACVRHTLFLIGQAEKHPGELKKQKVQKGLRVMQALVNSGAPLKNGMYVYYIIGVAYAESGQKAEAQKALKKAITLDPQNRNVPYLKRMIKKLGK